MCLKPSKQTLLSPFVFLFCFVLHIIKPRAFMVIYEYVFPLFSPAIIRMGNRREFLTLSMLRLITPVSSHSFFVEPTTICVRSLYLPFARCWLRIGLHLHVCMRTNDLKHWDYSHIHLWLVGDVCVRVFFFFYSQAIFSALLLFVFFSNVLLIDYDFFFCSSSSFCWCWFFFFLFLRSLVIVSGEFVSGSLLFFLLLQWS